MFHTYIYSRGLNNQPSSPIVRVLVSVFRRARPACDIVRHTAGVSGARIPNYRRSRIDICGTIRRRATSYKRRQDNIKQVQVLRGPVGESHTGHAPEHASFTVARHRHLSEFPPSSSAQFPLPADPCPCLWILKEIAEPRSGSGRAFKRNCQMSFVVVIVAPVKSEANAGDSMPVGQIRLPVAA